MADALHTQSTMPHRGTHCRFLPDQRPAVAGRRPRRRDPAGVGARAAPPHRDEAFVRVPGLRGLHRLGRRRAHQRLHVPGLRGLRKVCHDDRGAGARRPSGPTPRGLHPTWSSPVWLLYLRDAAGLQGTPGGVSQANQRADWPLPQRQYLPLRGLCPDSRGDPGRRRSEAKRRFWPAMAASGWPHVSRLQPRPINHRVMPECSLWMATRGHERMTE